VRAHTPVWPRRYSTPFCVPLSSAATAEIAHKPCYTPLPHCTPACSAPLHAAAQPYSSIATTFLFPPSQPPPPASTPSSHTPTQHVYLAGLDTVGRHTALGAVQELLALCAALAARRARRQVDGLEAQSLAACQLARVAFQGKSVSQASTSPTRTSICS
jgi:hypothetical protein